MNNMGGLNKLYYIDADDFVSIALGEDSLYDLTLDNGATVHEIEFTQDTGKISETEEETDHGTQYNFEATCRIPAFAVSGAALMGDLRHKKVMILGLDSNDNYILAGCPGSYFNVSISNTTGGAQPDPNSRSLKIAATLTDSVKFIESPF